MSDKYQLQVTAGPDYDTSTHEVVLVNSPDPVRISKDDFELNLSVRIPDYKGLPPEAPRTSPYFSHPSHLKDQYSISFTFVSRKGINGDSLLFGNDFDHPIRDKLPPGFSKAFKIVKWAIDPGLEGDPYGDKPYLYGPALSSLNIMQTGEKRDALDPWDHEEVFEESGDRGQGAPDDGAARRKFYLNEETRKEFVFEPGRVYSFDFFNPYLDFNEFSLRLPGFSLNIFRYWDGDTRLRYVLKDRDGTVYFVVVFTILLRDQSQQLPASDDEMEPLAITNEKVEPATVNGQTNTFEPTEDDVD